MEDIKCLYYSIQHYASHITKKCYLNKKKCLLLMLLLYNLHNKKKNNYAVFILHPNFYFSVVQEIMISLRM